MRHEVPQDPVEVKVKLGGSLSLSGLSLIFYLLVTLLV